MESLLTAQMSFIPPGMKICSTSKEQGFYMFILFSKCLKVYEHIFGHNFPIMLLKPAFSQLNLYFVN